jgi:hypothetical protein
MSEVVERLLMAIGIVAAAGGIGLLATRWSRPSHPAIDLDGLGLSPGIVMFTSADCSTCREAMARVGELGMAAREITHQTEPDLFERAGVAAVPLTAFIAGDGSVVAQFTGVPGRRALRRAAGAIG